MTNKTKKELVNEIKLLQKRIEELAMTDKVEYALRKSEERYRGLFEHMIEGYAYCQMHYENNKAQDWTYLAVNEAFESLTGLKGVAGKRVSEVIPGIREADPELFDIYSRVSQTGKPEKFEIFLKTLKMWFSVSVYSPEKGFFVAVFDVITERKRMEDELRTSEIRNRTLLENLPQKIFLKDRNSVYIACNGNYARDLKIKPEEIAGKTDYDFHPKNLAEKYRTDDKRVMESGKVEELEEKYIQEGREIVVHTIKTPVRDEHGNVVGILGIFWDITESKKMEEEKEKLKKSLAQSEKMAALGQLAAGVAHEINNPMTVILGFAQSCARKIKPGDQFELAVKSIEREALRCKNFIKTLLTFSRTSPGKKELIDVNLMIKDTIPLLEAQAKMLQVEIKKELSEGLPKILGNPVQIQQIIINLGNNAFDAMQKGGILTFKTELLSEKNKSWVCFKISDTGSGIPSEILPRIFDPFFTTKEIDKGTGLGLSLVYDMVKNNSGTIEAQSHPGCTEFIVKLQCME